jgi:deoxyribodipyrimidine photolyase-related protein
VTADVIDLVNARFGDHPGELENFAWPVNRKQSLEALDDFIEYHLADFGAHQDAMWTGEPFLSHSLLGSSLNLKLLHPLEVIDRAEQAYRDGKAPIESVEGFIRQILGWREYVRGIYWTQMPDYLELNALEADLDLPDFYWTGNTDMHCLSEVIRQTLDHGYSHHIQRLMVTGLYALLLGVEPKQVHEWYLAMYVDAVEWVELPNTLGMSQYADGGIMASKPYAATGKYIKRMSNFCDGCKFNPDKRTGVDACPFTVLYWDFLSRQSDRLKSNQRMSLQLRNLERLTDEEWEQINSAARKHRAINN